MLTMSRYQTGHLVNIPVRGNLLLWGTPGPPQLRQSLVINTTGPGGIASRPGHPIRPTGTYAISLVPPPSADRGSRPAQGPLLSQLSGVALQAGSPA